MSTSTRFKLLCVDDEPHVLGGLSLHLRRRYDVFTAGGGAAGLTLLAQERTIAVVISDMRMPEMDGATFLREARLAAPHATRILLTGQADIQSATAAINEGQIFRFLSKPCPPPVLLKAVEAAIEQYRLVTAERQLLEETLHGSIKALTDVLGLTSPVAFGRANRLKQHVSAILEEIGADERWQVEVAAMLSQLGAITLPPATIENLYFGRPLTPEEEEMASRAPLVTQQLLASIPRLEVVRGILAACGQTGATGEPLGARDADLVARGSRILRAAIDFDTLESQGESPSGAIGLLRGRVGRYDTEVLDALERVCGVRSQRQVVLELPLSKLEEGMVLAEDLKLATGVMLAARGYEVTQGFVERARNFRQGVHHQRIRVIVTLDSREAVS